ncbi:hypothetical protein G6F40_017224 [Rhizopus arrhizus]|nr:hypothetical protein G6F40_017224 [Rhizopus arrhizus]
MKLDGTVLPTNRLANRCARDVARLAGGGEETGEDLAAAAALRLVDDSDLPRPTSSRQLIPAGDPAGEHSAELGNRQALPDP